MWGSVQLFGAIIQINTTIYYTIEVQYNIHPTPGFSVAPTIFQKLIFMMVSIKSLETIRKILSYTWIRNSKRREVKIQ